MSCGSAAPQICNFCSTVRLVFCSTVRLVFSLQSTQLIRIHPLPRALACGAGAEGYLSATTSVEAAIQREASSPRRLSLSNVNSARSVTVGGHFVRLRHRSAQILKCCLIMPVQDAALKAAIEATNAAVATEDRGTEQVGPRGPFMSPRILASVCSCCAGPQSTRHQWAPCLAHVRRFASSDASCDDAAAAPHRKTDQGHRNESKVHKAFQPRPPRARAVRVRTWESHGGALAMGPAPSLRLGGGGGLTLIVGYAPTVALKLETPTAASRGGHLHCDV